MKMVDRILNVNYQLVKLINSALQSELWELRDKESFIAKLGTHVMTMTCSSNFQDK